MSISAIRREFEEQNRKKYADFGRKLGKLAPNVEEEYYKNEENAPIQKMHNNFR